jgi:hypothetical protein
MSNLRGLLKTACRVILALGLAGAIWLPVGRIVLGGPLEYAHDEIFYVLISTLPSALFLAACTVVVSGGLSLLISIDERLEQLVNKPEGQ